MAGKSVRWLRSIPSTKPDIRRSRLPIQKKNHSIRATFHTAWALCVISLPRSNLVAFGAKLTLSRIYEYILIDVHLGPDGRSWLKERPRSRLALRAIVR